MIALILGGAPSVWAEMTTAGGLLWPRFQIVVAANLAGIAYGDRLDAWATLHPDELPGWQARRQGNDDYRTFTPDETPERWPGSSGLYAVQVALFELGAAGVILCGVPMDSRAGHFTGRTPWESVTDYRRAFQAALPEIGGRVRSMGGWTQDLFGAPTREWIDAIHPARPLGVSRSTQAREAAMHKISNVSQTTQKFNALRPNGEMYIARLAPGQTDKFECDVNQAVFVRGLLKVEAGAAASQADEAAVAGADAQASETVNAATLAGYKPLKLRPAADA